MLNPEQTWKDAQANGGLRLEFPSSATATAGRHRLYRWRSRNGGYENIVITKEGNTLILKPFDIRATDLEGKPLAGSMEDAAAQARQVLFGEE